MLRLGIDVDGVVADFRSAFRALAEHELGIAPEDTESDLTKADIERLWRAVAGTPNWWLDVPAYEPDQIVRLYSRVRQSRWEVFFMTSRPPSGSDAVQLQTQVWLERYGFVLPSGDLSTTNFQPPKAKALPPPNSQRASYGSGTHNGQVPNGQRNFQELKRSQFGFVNERCDNPHQLVALLNHRIVILRSYSHLSEDAQA